MWFSAAHRTIRTRRPLGPVATLGPLRTIRPVAPFRAIDAHDAVVTAMTTVRTAIVPPAPLVIPVALDLLDLGVSRGDLLCGRRGYVGNRHQPQGQQRRYDSEMFHDSRPPLSTHQVRRVSLPLRKQPAST
jgi:hypothetical protein